MTQFTIPDPAEFLREFNEFVRLKASEVSTRSSEESYAHNQPGSASAPYWDGAAKYRAQMGFLAGEQIPEFNWHDANRLKEVVEKLGLRMVGPSDMFPYQAHAEDPKENAWFNTRYTFFFNPDGTLIGIHGWRGMHYRFEHTDKPYDQYFNEAIVDMAAQMQVWREEQDAKAKRLEESREWARQRKALAKS